MNTNISQLLKELDQAERIAFSETTTPTKADMNKFNRVNQRWVEYRNEQLGIVPPCSG